MDKNHSTNAHDYIIEIKEAVADKNALFSIIPINFFKYVFDKWLCSTYAAPFFDDAYDACEGIMSFIIKNKEKVAESICTFYFENRVPGHIMG